jgi:uncharacterized membrane protein YcaP (DUF421 family)
MSAEAQAHLAHQRRRLRRMIVIDVVCVLLAIGALVGAAVYHASALIWLFAAATTIGFGAQIWLIGGFVRAPKGEV